MNLPKSSVLFRSLYYNDPIISRTRERARAAPLAFPTTRSATSAPAPAAPDDMNCDRSAAKPGAETSAPYRAQSARKDPSADCSPVSPSLSDRGKNPARSSPTPHHRPAPASSANIRPANPATHASDTK